MQGPTGGRQINVIDTFVPPPPCPAPPGTIMPSLNTGSLPDLSNRRPVRFADTYPENELLLSWLRTEVVEEVLEPELPIVDCHHHFWDLRGKLYDEYNVGPRGQIVYGLDECLEDMCDGHNVTHTGQQRTHALLRPEGNAADRARAAHATWLLQSSCRPVPEGSTQIGRTAVRPSTCVR